DEKLTGLVELPVDRLDMCDELVGDLGECHLGHVELMFGDQVEQQVERAFEHFEVNAEDRCALVSVRLRQCGRCGGGFDRERSDRGGHSRAGSHRTRTSRASCRYDEAPRDDGAKLVMGNPATVVSGNRTVRPITVWKTRSPNA